jgi:hypothetical protein
LASVVNTTIGDPIGLHNAVIPYKSYAGYMLLRMVGRANTATRPLNITVKWNTIPMVQQAFFVESGAGGAFVGIWSLTGVNPATANIVITCGSPNDAGCAAIRVGELTTQPAPVVAAAAAGYGYTRTLATPGNAMLTVGGCANAETYPFTSPDLETQWFSYIAPKNDLPNRHNGLAGHFGLSYATPADGRFDIVPAKQINGVFAGIEIRPTSGVERAWDTL